MMAGAVQALLNSIISIVFIVRGLMIGMHFEIKSHQETPSKLNKVLQIRNCIETAKAKPRKCGTMVPKKWVYSIWRERLIEGEMSVAPWPQGRPGYPIKFYGQMSLMTLFL